MNTRTIYSLVCLHCGFPLALHRSLCYSPSLSFSLIKQFQWRRPTVHSLTCTALTLNSCALALAAVHRRVAAATTYCRHTNTITSLARLVGHCVWPLATTTTATTAAFARLALRLRFSFSLALLACGSQFATPGSICFTISPLVRSTTTTNELAAGSSSSSNKQMSAA